MVLGPNDLALKVLAAFGRGMTTYSVGSGNNAMPMDYLVVNANLFTGAISDTPYSTIPDTLGVPYFMAVSALSQIVGQNYATALASGTAGIVANDCTKSDGATGILRIAYPAISDSDLQTIAALLVTACTKGRCGQSRSGSYSELFMLFWTRDRFNGFVLRSSAHHLLRK